VANVSLLSKGSNREIWDKEPSEYFAEFEKLNPKLDRALRSHLIYNLDEFGIRTNDFPKFIDIRADVIANEINALAISLKQP
jgi:hypothetical protein